jgi:hypothetical protein
LRRRSLFENLEEASSPDIAWLALRELPERRISIVQNSSSIARLPIAFARPAQAFRVSHRAILRSFTRNVWDPRPAGEMNLLTTKGLTDGRVMNPKCKTAPRSEFVTFCPQGLKKVVQKSVEAQPLRQIPARHFGFE